MEIEAGLAPRAFYEESAHTPALAAGLRRIQTQYVDVESGRYPRALYSANILYALLSNQAIDVITLQPIDLPKWIEGYRKVFPAPSVQDIRNGQIADWASYFLFDELDFRHDLEPDTDANPLSALYPDVPFDQRDWTSGLKSIDLFGLPTKTIRKGHAPAGIYAMFRVCDLLNPGPCLSINDRLGEANNFNNRELWAEGWLRATKLPKEEVRVITPPKHSRKKTDVEAEIRERNKGSLYPARDVTIVDIAFSRPQPSLPFATRPFEAPPDRPSSGVVVPELVKDLRWENNSCYIDATTLALFYRPNLTLDEALLRTASPGNVADVFLSQVNKLRSGQDMRTMSETLSAALLKSPLSTYGKGNFCAIEEFINELFHYLQIKPVKFQWRSRVWNGSEFSTSEWKLEQATLWDVNEYEMENLAVACDGACDAINLRAVTLLSKIASRNKKRPDFTVEEKLLIGADGPLVIHVSRGMKYPVPIMPPETWSNGQLSAVICFRKDHFTTYFRGGATWYFYDGRKTPTIRAIRAQGLYSSYNVMLRLNEKEFPSVMKEGKVYVYSP